MKRALLHRSWHIAFALVCVLACGCQKQERASHEAPGAAATTAAAGAGASSTTTALATTGSPTDPARRIIRTAELSVETDAPEVAAARLAALADAKGGFVVSAETGRSTDADGAETVLTTVVLRVPVAAFDEALATARALGTRVSSEKVTGQDVTEEYVDLEARIRAQRAVEEQYLSTLKDARAIPDILAVQQKLGEVRTEIERAEGRRRLLESETTLSTITVHVARHLAAVEASGPGFGRSLRLAGRDSLLVAAAIVNGTIRTLGVLLPVGVLVVAPVALLVWLLRRRRSVPRLA